MMRTGTGRRGGSSRSVTFRKPFGSATRHLQDAVPDDVAVGVEPLGDRLLAGLQHGRVVAREHADEVVELGLEVREQRRRERRVGLGDVLLEQVAQDLGVARSELAELEFARRPAPRGSRGRVSSR